MRFVKIFRKSEAQKLTNQNAVQKENGISNGWLENAINSIFGDWNQQLLTQPMTAQKGKKNPKTFTYKHMYKSHFAVTLAIFKKSWVFFLWRKLSAADHSLQFSSNSTASLGSLPTGGLIVFKFACCVQTKCISSVK